MGRSRAGEIQVSSSSFRVPCVGHADRVGKHEPTDGRFFRSWQEIRADYYFWWMTPIVGLGFIVGAIVGLTSGSDRHSLGAEVLALLFGCLLVGVSYIFWLKPPHRRRRRTSSG
jgi:hypothetical protein